MDVAELDEAEFACVLRALDARALFGVDSPALFPKEQAAREAVYGAGLRQLQAHGWIKPLPQTGPEALDAGLRQLAKVVAAPELVMFTATPQPGGYQRLFLYYLAGDGIVELSKTLGCYRLLALPGLEALFERVTDMLGVFGPPPRGEDVPGHFLIAEQRFAAIKALAESGAVDEAASQLRVHGAPETARAELARALAQPEGSGMVVALRVADGAQVAAGRIASLYNEGGWVWLVQRLEAASPLLQVQVVEPDTLAGILREYLDFLKRT